MREDGPPLANVKMHWAWFELAGRPLNEARRGAVDGCSWRRGVTKYLRTEASSPFTRSGTTKSYLGWFDRG